MTTKEWMDGVVFEQRHCHGIPPRHCKFVARVMYR
jgi:hypothetical protein